MNIDQLLSLDKSLEKNLGKNLEKSLDKNDRMLTGLLAEPNRLYKMDPASSQVAFDFLSSYSNNSQKASQSMDLNANLIEQILKNPLFSKEADRLPGEDSPLASSRADRKQPAAASPGSENGFEGYFDRLLNRTELCNHPGIRTPQNSRQKSANKNHHQPNSQTNSQSNSQTNNHQSKSQPNSHLNSHPNSHPNSQRNGCLATAVAACYSNGLDMSKQAPDNASSLRRDAFYGSYSSSYGSSYRAANGQAELRGAQRSLASQRPPSQGSLNESVSSIDSDCDYGEMSKQLFQPKANWLRTAEGGQQRHHRYYPANQERGTKSSLFCSRAGSNGAAGLNDGISSATGLNALDALNESVVVEYQEWAQRTYGDSAKTKTVTRKKYERIVRILNGEEPNNVENSKFRFWVKSKGFRLGALSDDQMPVADAFQDVLYVPCIKSTANGTTNQRNKSHSFLYKKVACVENFFKIIYGVHVEMEGKAGKHAGQKRTYRAVAEMYAFLPREAVTRFLMSCKDCQKRMHLQINTFHKTLSMNPPLPLSPKQSFSRTGNANSANPSNPVSSSKSSPTDLKELLRCASLGSNALSNLANNLMANGAQPMNGKSEKQSSLANGFSRSSNSSQTTNGLARKGGDLSTTAYLKQINLLTKTGSMLGADLNSLMCNNGFANGLESNFATGFENGFNYLTDALSQSRELIETLSSDLNEESNSTPSLGIDEDEESVAEINSNDKYLDSAHLGGSSVRLEDSVCGAEIEQNGAENSAAHRQGDQTADKSADQMPAHKTNNVEDTGDQQINQTLLNNRTIGDERKRKWPSDCSDFEETNETEERKKLKTENLIDEEEESSDEIKQEEEESKEDVFEFHDPSGSTEFKEEEDSEEDEESGKLSDDNVDSDRLKAFNMFVRLFIDHNLDRSVPISRQPKEKIHGIIESCKRQFPELAQRARKRIRTYLKSCRRTKKIQNLRKLGHCSDFELRSMLGECAADASPPNDHQHLGLNRELIHQPVYHLNSPAAEKILASAFDNELLNARRIQDGLSPVLVNLDPNNLPVGPAASSSPVDAFKSSHNPYQTFKSNLISRLIGNSKDPQLEDIDKALNRLNHLTTNSSLENLKIANKEKTLASLLDSPNQMNELNSLNSLTNSKQLRELLSVEHLVTTPLNQLAIEASKSATSDLVARIRSNERFLTSLCNLSAKELVQIRQLITGYRESAAFLLRSAQELEYLLFKQQT